MLKLALEKVEEMLIEYFRISRLQHLHHGIPLYVSQRYFYGLKIKIALALKFIMGYRYF